MSLFGFDYAAGSTVLTGEGVRAVLPASAEFEPDFAHYLALTQDAFERLTFRYHDNSYIVYGADSPDFPLCLDFAELCAADVRKGAVTRQLPERPAFGVLEYTKNAVDPATGQNLRHAICFAIVAMAGGAVKLRYFEPQGDGVWMDTPDDCKSLDKFYV